MNITDWDGFRFFIAAAETGSLTAAAKQLGSNQPTVGRQIDALESALGIKLFQRSVKGLIMTEEGAFVFEQSKSMQSVADKIQRSMQGKDKNISGTVRVAMPEGLCLEVLTPMLPLFYSTYPNISLILKISPTTTNLSQGEADVAVRLFRPTEANLVAKNLGRMTLGLFASSAYLKSCGCPLSLSDLKQHRIITYGDQLCELAENQWLIKHSAPSSPALSSDNTIARLKATVAGVGISIQPRLFSQMNPELVPILGNTMLPDHEVWIAYHNDLRNLPRIRAVVGFLSENLELRTA